MIDTALERHKREDAIAADQLDRSQRKEMERILNAWFTRDMTETEAHEALAHIAIRGAFSIKYDTHVYTGYDYSVQKWRSYGPSCF